MPMPFRSPVQSAATARGVQGFSLLELVIAMAILALLVALGVPAYQGYAARGNRTAAKAFLNDLAQRQESFRADRRRYARTLSDLGYTTGTGGMLGTSASIDANGVLYATPEAGRSLYRVSLVLNPTNGTSNVRNCNNLGSALTAEAYRNAWAAVAAPESPQNGRDAACGTLCLNGTGRQGASGPDGWQACWRG